ncbi:MAG: DUF445 family protein [Sphingobacteriales bacterium]|nr:DUF445 family protein [Sphingobacteriales bacterium]
MNYWLILIPLISALAGWFTIWLFIKILFHPQEPRKILGIRFQGILPKRQVQLGESLGKLVREEFLSFEELENKINSPENSKKIMPLIESHIDDFLRNRLSKEMPMISMFIGDKTIGKLKGAFLAEIELLFPAVMKQYAGNLKAELDPEQLLSRKLAGFSSAKLEKILHRSLSRELRLAGLLGAAVGLLAGLLQVLVIFLTR